MRGRSLLFACMLLGAVTAALAQQPDGENSDPLPTPPQAIQPTLSRSSALVRLRYVKGQVSILNGKKVEFPQARANMPVLSGSTLATGEDGQAEIEFNDGSVARLTPQTRLRLVRLPRGNDDPADNTTNLELLAGLCYLELNIGEQNIGDQSSGEPNGDPSSAQQNTTGQQHYSVRFGRGLVQPAENSIFRIDLDQAPELAVFVGAVQARADGGFDQRVEQGESLRLAKAAGSEARPEPQLSQNIREDSWDRWNQDRDEKIAAEASQQTAASEQSSAAAEPGWNELDAYGNWYPTEQYGNVWVPGDVGEGWDPYSSGYWADYPGWGYTWISANPWGWLPYQCGAWNYWDSVGWGWIPGECGWGSQPVVTIWNAAPGFHAPPRPIPGGHAGAPTLVAVHRGPPAPANGALSPSHTRPVRIDGQRLDPLPILERPGEHPGEHPGTAQSFRQTGRVGVPLPVGRRMTPMLQPGRSAHLPADSGISIWPRGAGVRPPSVGTPGMGNGSRNGADGYGSGGASRSSPRSPAQSPSQSPSQNPSRIEPLRAPAISGPRIAPVSPGAGVPKVTAPPPSAPRMSAPTVTAPSAPHANPAPVIVAPAPVARPH